MTLHQMLQQLECALAETRQMETELVDMILNWRPLDSGSQGLANTVAE